MKTKRLFTKQRIRKGLFLLSTLLLCFTSSLQAQNESSPFTARLSNIESTTEDPFRFDLTLHNQSKESKFYELAAELPTGWVATFKSSGTRVTALKLEPGTTGSLSLEIRTGIHGDPHTYKIPVTAIDHEDTLRLELQAVVKGSYGLELTTPSGKLSDNVTEGSSKNITLRVKNTGTLPLKDVELKAQSPSQWSATFDESKIDNLGPGETKDVKASVEVPSKTIAGDYVVTFNANNDFSKSDAQFRVTVKTSILSGWVGIVIILAALALIYFLIRKYGRR